MTFSILLLAACTPFDGGLTAAGIGPFADDGTTAARLSSEDASWALLAANELDHASLDAVLDVRAADNIVAQRPFADLDALDAVPYVGPAALEALAELGASVFSTPSTTVAIPDEVFVLWAANHLDEATLDLDVALDSRAAGNLVEGAPYGSVEEVDAVGYVGPSALAKLVDYGRNVFGDRCTPGTVSLDGLAYTDLQAAFDDASTGATLLVCEGDYDARNIVVSDAIEAFTVLGLGAHHTRFVGDAESTFAVPSDGYKVRGTLSFQGVSFVGYGYDTGSYSAGALQLGGTDLTIVDTVFEQNGRAIDLWSSGWDQKTVLRSVEFRDNRISGGFGSTVEVFELDARDVAFLDNVGTSVGAALVLRSGRIEGGWFGGNADTSARGHASILQWDTWEEPLHLVDTVLDEQDPTLGAAVGFDLDYSLSVFSGPEYTADLDGWIDDITCRQVDGVPVCSAL